MHITDSAHASRKITKYSSPYFIRPSLWETTWLKRPLGNIPSDQFPIELACLTRPPASLAVTTVYNILLT